MDERGQKDSLVRQSPTRTRSGLLLLFITFIIFAFPLVNDPDFGWHLKSGEFYVQTYQIPDHDIFSYTMNDYPWVNHEYAIDSFYYLLYRFGGNNTILLSFLFLLIAILIYLVVLPLTFARKLYMDERLFAGIMALLVTRVFFGVRSQVFDWLGFLLVIFIWKKYEKTLSKKTLLWYIPLFFLWANIHGGFFIGFVLLGFFFCAKTTNAIKLRGFSLWFTQHKIKFFSELAILLITAAFTLLTPYDVGLYQDIIHTLGNSTMLESIDEWRPSVASAQIILPFTVFMFSFIFLLMLEKRKQSFAFRDAFLIVMFLFLALSSMRFIPFFIFLSLPILYSAFTMRELFLPMMLLMIFPSFVISTLGNQTMRTKDNPSLISASPLAPHAPLNPKGIFYSHVSPAALDYLAAHPMKGNMFNDYGWGGTLIWLFPQYKVFIDGRMPYWKIHDRAIFEDYLTIDTVKEGWDKKINAYGIDWFFIRRSSRLAAVLVTLPEHWDQIYEDDIAVIFVKK